MTVRSQKPKWNAKPNARELEFMNLIEAMHVQNEPSESEASDCESSSEVSDFEPPLEQRILEVEYQLERLERLRAVRLGLKVVPLLAPRLAPVAEVRVKPVEVSVPQTLKEVEQVMVKLEPEDPFQVTPFDMERIYYMSHPANAIMPIDLTN